jgi:hypothetical protein
MKRAPTAVFAKQAIEGQTATLMREIQPALLIIHQSSQQNGQMSGQPFAQRDGAGERPQRALARENQFVAHFPASTGAVHLW